MTRQVRTYTRRTASGRTTTVRRHTRAGQKLKDRRGPNPYHAGKLAKRSRAHVRRGRKGKAAMLGFLALGEVTAWFTLSTTSFILVLIGGLCVGLSILLTR